MTNQEKVAGYLRTMAVEFEEAAPDTWIIRDGERALQNLVIKVSEPVVIIRMKVMEAPASRRAELFEELLRLNAADLVYGAYALEGNSVVLTHTLYGATLDFDELRESLEAIGLAPAEHYRILAKYRAEPKTGG